MYGDLTKTQSEEEDEVKCNVARKANDSVILERTKDDLTKALLMENHSQLYSEIN